MDYRNRLKSFHDEMEREPLAKLLITGRIDLKQSVIYLRSYQPLIVRLCLDNKEIQADNVLSGLNDNFQDVYQSLINEHNINGVHGEVANVAMDYRDYLKSLSYISGDDDKVKAAMFAHVYVQVMGFLSGGQMTNSRSPIKSLYDLPNIDIDDTKNTLRGILSGYMMRHADMVIMEMERAYVFTKMILSRIYVLSENYEARYGMTIERSSVKHD